MRTLFLWIALATAPAAQDPQPFPAGGLELPPQSVWTASVPSEGRNGAFAVGNGHVFASAGAGSAPSTIRSPIGPHYGSDALPSASWSVLRQGRAAVFANGRLARLRGAPVVLSESEVEGATLRTALFAPPGQRHLLQLVEWSSDQPADLVLSMAGARPDEDGSLRIGVARATLTEAESRPGQLVVPAAVTGRQWRGVVCLSFDGTATDDGFRDLEQCLAWWTNRLRRTTRFDTDHARFRDLIDGWKVDVLAQTCARTGVPVAMLGDRRASLDESCGSMLALLRFGLFDDARRLLEFWFRAVRADGTVRAARALEPGADSSRSFTDVRIPEANAASWLILQHYWYWRATRDLELIERHWPLLDVCLKRQPRRDDVLLPFSGSERWLADGGIDRAGARDPKSFSNATLFLLSVYAIGDLLDARARAKNPELYAGDDAAEGPGKRLRRRGFELMRAIEERYWLPKDGRFAPSLSPVDHGPRRGPVAHANLMPLWAGWTYPTGEKSRDNLRNTLAALPRRGVRIGTTTMNLAATGDLQAMLLMALSERDATSRMDVFDSVLELAAPAGEWPDRIEADGTAVGHLSPGIAGRNLEALLFATTGIRHLSVPGWDDNDIRLGLELPHGAQWMSVKRARKDTRTLNLFFRRELGKLSPEELTANAELEEPRDPEVEHERLEFVVELVEGEPTRGRVFDVALSAMGTMFVRFLSPDPPATVDATDFRRIEDREFVTPRTRNFLPTEPPTPAPEPRTIPEPGARLRLTAQPARDLDGAGAIATWDLSWPNAALIDALLDAGQPRFGTVEIESPLPAAAADAVRRYEAAGGSVVRPRFWRTPIVDPERGTRFVPDPSGRIQLPLGPHRLRLTLEPTDRFLRVASTAAYRILSRGGDPVDRPAGTSEPFGSTHRLADGTNRLTLELQGPATLTLATSR